ncbi:MAG: hypothetical protein JWM34_393 [Ilumatobacteraceae bacterium]|nr:hypothetical protein [Ilumatobacteraceae bacterium]
MSAVKRSMSSVVLVGLAIIAVSCGSDSAAPASTTAPSFPHVDEATLTSLQHRVVDITNADALAVGLKIDHDCLVSVGAHFSEADAKLINDANTNAATHPNAEPILSAQGSTLAAAVKACVIPATTTTIGGGNTDATDTATTTSRTTG